MADIENGEQIAQAEPASAAPSIQVPPAGERVVVQVQPGQQIPLAFDPNAASVGRAGNDLVLTFEDGGSLVLQGFAAANQANPAAIVLPDGTILAANVILASLGVTEIDTAAGPAGGPGGAGGGSSSYSDNLGDLIDGLNAQGGLGATPFGFYQPTPEQGAGAAAADEPVTTEPPTTEPPTTQPPETTQPPTTEPPTTEPPTTEPPTTEPPTTEPPTTEPPTTEPPTTEPPTTEPPTTEPPTTEPPTTEPPTTEPPTTAPPVTSPPDSPPEEPAPSAITYSRVTGLGATTMIVTITVTNAQGFNFTGDVTFDASSNSGNRLVALLEGASIPAGNYTVTFAPNGHNAVIHDAAFMGNDLGRIHLQNKAVSFNVTVTKDNATGDIVWGTDGNDTIFGDGGDNRIVGGGGDDEIHGGAGNDTIWGGAGNDIIHGGDDDDQLIGGAGNDVIYGGAGDDKLWGGEGNDQLYGGDGNDILWGGAGDDLLHGGDGDDLLIGGAGNDILIGGTGNDTMWGGEGADVFRFETVLDGHDIIHDFSRTEGDKLDLDALLAAGAEVTVTHVGADTVVTAGDDFSVTVVNIHLTEVDFTSTEIDANKVVFSS